MRAPAAADDGVDVTRFRSEVGDRRGIWSRI